MKILRKFFNEFGISIEGFIICLFSYTIITIYTKSANLGLFLSILITLLYGYIRINYLNLERYYISKFKKIDLGVKPSSISRWPFLLVKKYYKNKGKCICTNCLISVMCSQECEKFIIKYKKQIDIASLYVVTQIFKQGIK